VPSRGLTFDAEPILETCAGGTAGKQKSSGTRESPAVLQSQRDCVFQPRVARNATLGCCRGDFQPQRGCVKFPPSSRNPVGVVCLLPRFPRVARSSQPWALCRNPVGIQLWNFRTALPQAQIVGAIPLRLSSRRRSRGSDNLML